MLLLYFDESGTNYKIKDGLFIDGPFLIFGAMLVHEDVYWSLERLFCDLINKYFGIENWLNHEVHATDIWAGNLLSNKMNLSKRREFFDEFLQLCGKFGLNYLFSFNLKYNKHTIYEKNLNLIKSAYCLLLNIEHKLADLHQTGVLVADVTTDSDKLRLKNILTLDLNKKCIASSQALLRVFNAMTSWRSVKIKNELFDIKPKYPMESRSVYLIDRVHFLSSDDSLFLQMCDILTFIIQRALAYEYLSCVARGDPKKVPISKNGLSMIREKISASTYNDEIKDVEFWNIQSQLDNLIFDFKLMVPFENKLKDHYSELQQNN